MTEITPWLQFGFPAALVVLILFGIWKLINKYGDKVYTLGERYVASTESLHETLDKAEENRSKLCEQHVSGLGQMAGAVTDGNRLLTQLVVLHQEPGGMVHDAIGVIKENSQDLQRVKQAASRACEMCRTIAKIEFPNSADKVSQHCDEIERIIGEA